ncbi:MULTISPECIES: hypothetical protein [Streptomyces]|uniref:Uncharacterized protein n=1 Tax=Streptomyces ardesiacus TaxID=285564 RepID=A0ABW8H7L7_9ACTN|nr:MULTISPECIES: hypothetical protein [Streptomyces]KOT99636.1 hypothetical protein ADK87_13740 [Streptomyces sp. NRRL F-4711]KOX31821.1 hypothetical protein ADL07_15095 [Streptomyces sp. NRRL F-4707]MCL7364810.1 hypothetical protein [Streptomyces ardesiacus]NEB60439.1 hypothetical protein [Streptomyces diastaticus]
MKSHGGSESGGVPPTPRISAELARATAEEAVRAIAGGSSHLVRDLDVDQSRHVLPQPQSPSEKLALLHDRTRPRPAPPVAGVPRARAFWREMTVNALTDISSAVRGTLWERTDLDTDALDIVGPHGDPATRLEQIRTCIEKKRSFVSIALCGSLQDLLVTGHPWAASLSILAKAPGEPIAAAVATARQAMAADCSDAYRLLLPEGDWKMRTEDDVHHPVAPGYVILPKELRVPSPLPEQLGAHAQFADDTASAITEALIGGHIPLAVYHGGHVLQSAVVLVAAAHGFFVRPLTEGGTVLAPWQCAGLLASSLSKGTDIPGLVLGRYEINAKNLAQHLGRVPLAAR